MDLNLNIAGFAHHWMTAMSYDYMQTLPDLSTVMENPYFSYASFIFVLNACTANLPLPFSIITSKCIFEVGVPILFGFSVKLSVDLFQWESRLIDYVIEFHSSPLQKI